MRIVGKVGLETSRETDESLDETHVLLRYLGQKIIQHLKIFELELFSPQHILYLGPDNNNCVVNVVNERRFMETQRNTRYYS